MSRYSITTDISVQLVGILDAIEHPLTLKLTFDVRPSFPETRLQPGEPASVEVLTATIVEHNGWHEIKHEAPNWLWRMIEKDDRLEAEMLREAWESDEAARDDHADMVREERLLERMPTPQNSPSNRGGNHG